MKNIKDFIVRTRLGNTDENQRIGDSSFDTQDYVFLETYDEVKGLSNDDRIAYASDYALMIEALMQTDYVKSETKWRDRLPTLHQLRTAKSNNEVFIIDWHGRLNYLRVLYCCAGLCPAMHLNISSVIAARSASLNFKIDSIRDKNGNILYHTIEFGSYPQDKAKNSDELERLYNDGKLIPTGKKYNGHMDNCFGCEQNEEFEYCGKKFVRVITFINRDLNKFAFKYKDGTELKNQIPMWVEVQPIKWKIKNWDKLPRELNPNGTGTAKTIYVKSEEGIISGIPFYFGDSDFGESSHAMWQNSMIRALFNGYDIYEEIDKGNGNKSYKADINFNFKGNGFLEQAFDGCLSYSKEERTTKTKYSTTQEDVLSL